jgi:hypothetical protein
MNKAMRRGWYDHKAGLRWCPQGYEKYQWHRRDWLHGWAKRDKMTGYPFKMVCLLKDKP